jgi:hypothetical protein
MVGLFTSGNFLGVIVLGAGFGVALVQLQKDMPPEVKWDKIITIQVIEEVMQVFMKFVNWIIKLTPFGIMSLIAAAVGAQSDLGVVFAQIGVLVAAILVGLLIQVSVVYSGLYTLFVRKNALKYYKHLIPAWMMAFASSSSAATIPVSLECVVSSGEVPVGVARFVVPLGATSTSKYYLFAFLLPSHTGFLFRCQTNLMRLHFSSLHGWCCDQHSFFLYLGECGVEYLTCDLERSIVVLTWFLLFSLCSCPTRMVSFQRLATIFFSS